MLQVLNENARLKKQLAVTCSTFPNRSSDMSDGNRDDDSFTQVTRHPPRHQDHKRQSQSKGRGGNDDSDSCSMVGVKGPISTSGDY